MAGKTIYLDADLDLAGHEWRSIGIGSNHSLFFGGTFNGQNHYITNLTSKSSADRQGLFGILSDGALVQNLNILNADIYSANDHLVEGILADWANGSTVLNCYTSGRVESAAGNKMLGGLVGQCTWDSQIIGLRLRCCRRQHLLHRGLRHSRRSGRSVGKFLRRFPDLRLLVQRLRFLRLRGFRCRRHSGCKF